MNLREELERTKNLLVVKECLVDYVGPIFVFGNIESELDDYNPCVISATMDREEFVILNGKVPMWIDEITKKASEVYNILIIKDMDKISLEKQEILLDILENNQVSLENLPENLKIILTATSKCDINSKIRDIVECYEI